MSILSSNKHKVSSWFLSRLIQEVAEVTSTFRSIIKSYFAYVYTFKGDEQGRIDMPFGHSMNDCYNDYFSKIITDENYDSYKADLLLVLSDSDKEILNSYNPDDNPIIVMFKFKDF